MSLVDVLAVPYTPSGFYAPALPPSMAAADRHYVVAPAEAGAPRWHLGYDADRARYIVSRRMLADAPLLDVVPTVPGARAALSLADALNRAYGINPVAGYDASPRLFWLG